MSCLEICLLRSSVEPNYRSDPLGHTTEIHPKRRLRTGLSAHPSLSGTGPRRQWSDILWLTTVAERS